MSEIGLGCEKTQVGLLSVATGFLTRRQWNVPGKSFDISERCSLIREEYHSAQSVSVIGIAGEIRARCGSRGCTNAIDVAVSFDKSGQQHVLQHISAVKIDVGRDFMRGQIPCLRSEAHSDIPAHLPDPYPSSLKRVRRKPEPCMNALIYCRSCLLQNEVFLAIEDVQRTHRRSQKLISKNEGPRSFDGTCEIELPGKMPATGDERNNRTLPVFDNDEIERIAVARVVSVGGAADLLRKRRSQ